MSEELVSILVLVAVFLIATLLSINMGVLGLVAAFGLGTALGVAEDDVFAGFPGDLFVILVGVTYLLAIAKNNGTVDWLVHAAVRAVGGRTAAIPGAMFLVTAILTAVGSVVPAAVVDSSPFSTSGALVVANTSDERRDFVFRRLMQWGMSMILIAPLIAWTVFVVPGWR